MMAILGLWFVAGLLAGGVHVGMLWQATQAPFHGAAWHWTRLLFVAGVLVAAAIAGGILQAATGWAVAYFATIGVVATRKPR